MTPFDDSDSDGDLPTAPRHTVRIARGARANEAALARHRVFGLTRAWDDWTDAELARLALEAEFLADCTPLERELAVRLATRCGIGPG